jgi:long-chain fatty acid transport protein
MTLHRATRFMLALALLGLPAAAGAQAFALNEIGTCALARGFATTSAPCDDASSIYWNPGKMPSARGWSAYGGAAIISLKGTFTQDTTYREWESDVPTAVVPHFFVTYRGAGKAAYGLGVYVPYGLTSQWGDDFPGRFSAKKASLQSIYFQPNITYQITDNWSVGGGPVFGHSSVELVQAIDLSSQIASAGPPVIAFGQLGIAKRTEFARATLKGSANAFGIAVGVHGKLTPNWTMGARFLSQLSFSYDDADATFAQVPTGLVVPADSILPGVPKGTPIDALVAGQFTSGALVAQKVQTQIRHPAQVQVGFGYTGFENTTITAEYSYVGFKSFNQLPVNFQGPAPSRVLQEDYNNTSGLRLGAERRLASGAALRAGYAVTAAAAPDETVTPLLPEQDRALGMLGAGIPLGQSFAVDLSYAHIFTPGRRGRLDERPVNSSAATAVALNNGAYTLNANIFSLSLKASF